MNTIGRRSLALTLSTLVLAACATATPSEGPSASASPTESPLSPSPSADLPSTSPSSTPSSAPTATPGPTQTPSSLVVKWQRSADVAAPKDSWWSWAGSGQNVTWTKLGDTYLFPVDTQGYADGPMSGPQIWLSDDLLHWRRATIPQPTNQHLSVTAVSVGGPGLVAIGTDVPDDAPQEMLWTSVDGNTWKQASSEQATGLTPGQLWLLRATASGDVSYDEGMVDVTRFLGTALEPDTSSRIIEEAGDLTVFTDPAVTSNDVEIWQAAGSSAWHKSATIPKSSSATLFDAVHGAHGYFVFGCASECSATRGWTSVDGVTWLSSDVATFDSVNAILADQSGFIAVGQRVTGSGCAVAESEIYGESWTSSDGHTWRKMKDEAQFNHASIYLLVTRDRTLLGVGMRWTSDHAVPTVWTATLPNDSIASSPAPTPTPPPAQPGGCGD